MTNNGDAILKTNATEDDVLIEPNEDIPNKDTIEAIEEGEKMLHDPSTKKYTSIEDLKKAFCV